MKIESRVASRWFSLRKDVSKLLSGSKKISVKVV